MTSHTAPLTPDQAERLRALLHEQDYKFIEKPYTLYAATKPGLQISVYTKGPKVLLQGKGTAHFLEFHLEPQILQEARLGYDHIHHPEMFTPHIGVDESGKGDYFGPLVIAATYTDHDIARQLQTAGVQDSKAITSDTRIRALAKQIRSIPGLHTALILITPPTYNRLHAQMGANLNRLLAWGHARAIEDLLAKQPDCPRALSDQFADPSLIRNALLTRGRAITLEQRPRAESDPAVAAASILAREAFIDWMDHAGKKLQAPPLPRGASAQVKTTALALHRLHGPPFLPAHAKLHFKTTTEILASTPPSPEH